MLFYIAYILLFVRSVTADACTSLEALGYINVTRSLDLAYIDEQTQASVTLESPARCKD